MTQATPNTCTIFCTHTHPHAHARSNTHTSIRAGSDNTHTHTAYAFSLCALKFQFLCLKVKERTKGRRKTAGNCCPSSHRNWKFLYKLQLLCYNIPFHNCLSHCATPRSTVLRLCMASVWMWCLHYCIQVDWLTTHIHTRTRPHTYAQLCLCMCKSGSARVTMCVWVWHKHVFIVYASARHLNIWDTLLSFRLYTICEYLNVYHISILCRRGIFL